VTASSGCGATGIDLEVDRMRRGEGIVGVSTKRVVKTLTAANGPTDQMVAPQHHEHLPHVIADI